MMPDHRECCRGAVRESDEGTERVVLSLSVQGDSGCGGGLSSQRIRESYHCNKSDSLSLLP